MEGYFSDLTLQFSQLSETQVSQIINSNSPKSSDNSGSNLVGSERKPDNNNQAKERRGSDMNGGDGNHDQLNKGLNKNVNKGLNKGEMLYTEPKFAQVGSTNIGAGCCCNNLV